MKRKEQRILQYLTGYFWLLALLVLAYPAQAVPSFWNLQPGNNYGGITVTMGQDNHGNTTACFTVNNWQGWGGCGINGLVVYCPCAPTSMSQPGCTSTCLYDQNTQSSCWNFNNGWGQCNWGWGCWGGNWGWGNDCVGPGQCWGGNGGSKCFTLTFSPGCNIDASCFHCGVRLCSSGSCGGWWGGSCGGNSNCYAHCCALICGQVNCASCGCPVSCTKVQLVNSKGCVVATTRTDCNGYYCFDCIQPGCYTVQVCSVDFQPSPSNPFNFNGKCNVQVPISATPQPVGYSSQASQCGEVLFFDSTTLPGSLSVSSTTLTQTDLSNPAYVSSSVVYPYTGTIPNFPNLGTFGSSNPVYVYIVAPLMNPNVWSNCSFVNLVGVRLNGAANYTLRDIFDIPFTGPGTAYNYMINSLTLTNSPTTPIITQLSPIWVGSGPAPSPPPPGTYPAGWMAQTLFEFSEPPATPFSYQANGSFTDACCDCFPFSICPSATLP